MTRLTQEKLHAIAEDVRPCDHHRYQKLSDVAHKNGISRVTLDRLLNGRHALSRDFHEILEQKEKVPVEKPPKSRGKRGKK